MAKNNFGIKINFKCVLRIIAVICCFAIDRYECGKSVRRKCDFRNFKKKGDVGTLPPKSIVRHPRDVLKLNSRKKRFIGFPEGSSVTLKSEISIVEFSDMWENLKLFIGLPISLDLPSNIFDYNEDRNDLGTSLDSYYYEGWTARERQRRSVDGDRKNVFAFIEKSLEKFGLPGRPCLLSTICEMANKSTETHGLLGDILALIFSPGYGEDPEEDDMRLYSKAEMDGWNSNCSSLISECPFYPMDFVDAGLELISHAGLEAF